ENQIQGYQKWKKAGEFGGPPIDFDPSMVEYIPEDWGAASKQMRAVEAGVANKIDVDIKGPEKKRPRNLISPRARRRAAAGLPFPRPVARGHPPGLLVIPSRIFIAVLAVATGLAVGLVGCGRTPPTGATAAAGPLAAPAPGWFDDVTDAVGLNFTHECG